MIIKIYKYVSSNDTLSMITSNVEFNVRGRFGVKSKDNFPSVSVFVVTDEIH